MFKTSTADRVNLMRSVSEFELSPQFDGYSKVELMVDKDTIITSGSDSGRVLRVDCEWGSQEIADNILAAIKNYQYQPYTAGDALLDPAAELMDGVTIDKTYCGIYSMEINFGPAYRADIGAPMEEETDHEYPYMPQQERKIYRQIHGLTSELRVQAEIISAEVTDRKTETEELRGLLTVQANRITAEVSQRKQDIGQINSTLSIHSDKITAKVNRSGGNSSSFGWTLSDSDWRLSAGGADVFRVNKLGAELKGKIVATSGKIGGFDIMSDRISYNNATWGGTNTTGIYFGPKGIQLGKNFKVDSSGNLFATSGTFTGSVRAGNIKFGGDNGYMDGYGIQAGTVRGGSGGEIRGGSISTFNTSGGINTSLGYADYANGVLNGWNEFGKLSGSNLIAKQIQASQQMILRGRYLKLDTITYKDGSGVTRTKNIVTWEVAS